MRRLMLAGLLAAGLAAAQPAQSAQPDGLTVQATVMADTMIRASGKPISPAERLALIQQLRSQLRSQVQSESGTIQGQASRSELVRRIDAARRVIRLATPAVRDVEVARAILRAAERGVQVRILVDSREVNPQTSYNLTLSARRNIAVRGLRAGGDSIINLDETTVVSANLVNQLQAQNQPAQLVDNTSVARINASQFDTVWTQARPLPSPR